MRVFFSLAALGLLVAAPVLADTVTGRVVEVDTLERQLVMEDRTIWSTDFPNLVLPETLSSGDLVLIKFTSLGDDGIKQVDGIELIEDN